MWIATCRQCGNATFTVDETIAHDNECSPHLKGRRVCNSTYVHFGCRCRGCTAAHAVYNTAYNSSQRVTS